MEKYVIKIETSNNTPSYYQKGNGDPSRTISLHFAEIFSHDKLAENTKARLSKIYPQREFTVVPVEVTITEK